MDATILDIQRMSTEDGPGLRTTVFFKGCNLVCGWCHNPESINFKPDPNWFLSKCIGCSTCKTSCSHGAIIRNEDGIQFDRKKCQSCGACAKRCPSNAIELKGKKIHVTKLFNELIKDEAYFGPEGGVTLSGGEVMMQAEVATELARLLKNKGINVAIDTAGCYDYRLLEKIMPYVDLILYDLKVFNPIEHMSLTRVDNKLILENYKRLIVSKVRLWIRTPIIQNATDTDENILGLAEFIKEAGYPERWELCAFNNLCRSKYERLGIEWQYKEYGLLKRTRLEHLTALAMTVVPMAMYSGAVADI
ncbi:MAG: glycyl-radical enzyme activating protein [Christensenellaceae bacterium]|jgi:pyruvate formate lyase activating enzyme|nr:glycyl-radical enzyme activating protein [Christensenellaceae bacterium]